jgi:cell division protein FtsB
MASARSAQAKRRPATGRAGARARPRVVAGGGGAARGIRWDRVGRVALLAVLVVIVFLYVGPARSYISTLRESKQRSAEVAQLRRENRKLRARRDALRNPRALEREARRLGMVRPTERSYVVKNLPKGP